MLIMLLLARRFRAFFAACATYFAVAAVMTATYGVHSWYEFFRLQGGVSDEWVGSVLNGSLSGLVVQLATPACIAQGHPNRTTTAITLVCSLALLGLSAWVSRSDLERARTRDARAIDLPFSLFALLSVFLNAWIWDHYAVLAVQPLFILAATFSRTWQASFRRWCEERCSTRTLIKISAACAAGGSGILVTLQALSVDGHELPTMLNLWREHHLRFYHRNLHRLQAENFAVWVVPIALCFLAIVICRSVSRDTTAER
jgi:hypothetical protein